MPGKPKPHAPRTPNINAAREQRIRLAARILCVWLRHRGADTTTQLENLAHAAVKAAAIIQTES